MRKRDPQIGHVDASHSRAELGNVSLERGIIPIAIDVARGKLRLADYEHDLAEVHNADAIITTAGLVTKENSETVAQARIIIAALIDAAMARDSELSRRVQEEIARIRD